MKTNTIILGDCRDVLRNMPDESVNCIITSPPYYGLRDYGTDAQIGIEETPEEYIQHLVEIFQIARRVLCEDGTLWLNIGDTYSSQRWTGNGKGQPMNKFKDGHRDLNLKRVTGLPPKNLIGIPWKLALALQADGWILRQDIIWSKPNPMPEPVKDRFCKSHEYIFLFSKQQKYYFDHNAALEESISAKTDPRLDAGRINYKGKCQGEAGTGQRNFVVVSEKRTKRDVWHIPTRASMEKHFATFPEKLIMPCVLCGCPENGIVLDPFVGSGTTALVAEKLGRQFIGIELNPEYHALAQRRVEAEYNNIFNYKPNPNRPE